MPAPTRSDLIVALIAAGRRLDALGLVPARDGNLSARLPRGEGTRRSPPRHRHRPA